MSETSNQNFYQSCNYYWLIFTGEFCKPNDARLTCVWESISKKQFEVLFKVESWKSVQEMLEYFHNLADRLVNLKSFR